MPPYSAQPHHDSSGGATPPEVQFVGGVHSHGSVACAAAALARIKSCTSRSSIFGAPRLSDHRSQKNSRMKRIWQSFRATEFVGVMHESYAWESMHESVWFCRLCAVGDGRAAQHTQGRDSVWDRFIHSLPSIASRTHTHTHICCIPPWSPRPSRQMRRRPWRGRWRCGRSSTWCYDGGQSITQRRAPSSTSRSSRMCWTLWTAYSASPSS